MGLARKRGREERANEGEIKTGVLPALYGVGIYATGVLFVF